MRVCVSLLCVSSYYYMCPHTYVCPRTIICVTRRPCMRERASYYYMCVHVPYMCPHISGNFRSEEYENHSVRLCDSCYYVCVIPSYYPVSRCVCASYYTCVLVLRYILRVVLTCLKCGGGQPVPQLPIRVPSWPPSDFVVHVLSWSPRASSLTKEKRL